MAPLQQCMLVSGTCSLPRTHKQHHPGQGKPAHLLAIGAFIPNVHPLCIPLYRTAALRGCWNKGKTKSACLHASPLPLAELLLLPLLLLLLL